MPVTTKPLYEPACQGERPSYAEFRGKTPCGRRAWWVVATDSKTMTVCGLHRRPFLWAYPIGEPEIKK